MIIRHIERDAAYEEELTALEGIFWNENVLKKIPPPYTEDGDLVLQSVKHQVGMADPEDVYKRQSQFSPRINPFLTENANLLLYRQAMVSMVYGQTIKILFPI